jgi:hypothetical protein
MHLTERRRRFDALPPEALPEQLTGERDWVDRVRDFEGFERFGPLTAAHVRALEREGATSVIEHMRERSPELLALVLEAFPDDPPDDAYL